MTVAVIPFLSFNDFKTPIRPDFTIVEPIDCGRAARNTVADIDAGVPLAPSSKIDYLMYSKTSQAAWATILCRTWRKFRQNLLPADINDWRAHLSDYLPVPIRFKIVLDDD